MNPFALLFCCVVAVEGSIFDSIIVDKQTHQKDVKAAVELLGSIQHKSVENRKLAAWGDPKMATVGPGNLEVFCEAALIGGENSDAAVIDKRCVRSLKERGQRYVTNVATIQYTEGVLSRLDTVACKHAFGDYPIPNVNYPLNPADGNAVFVKIDQTGYNEKFPAPATKFVGCY